MAGHALILNFLRDMRVTAPEQPAKIPVPVRVPKRKPVVSIDGDEPQKIVEFNLRQAAKELNVGYKAARRLCLTQGCARYSCGAGDEVIFPSNKSKRKGTNTRMTWKITPADIAAIKLAMRKK